MLAVTATIGAGIAMLLTWASEEIYDSIKAANGLSSLDEPVLSRAVSLRKPQANAQGRGVGCHVVGHPVATGDRALVEDRRGAP